MLSFICIDSSIAWEIRSEVPASIEAGQPIILDLWEWLAAGDCYACRGYEVEYGDLGADVFLSIERVKPLGDPCNGPGEICEYLVEVTFQEPGQQLLRLVERVIAPIFGGDTVIAEYQIEVEPVVPISSTTWSTIKTLYR